ncbi:MAG: methyl-accepting chemotaxis protein [Syntrophales bacterium]|jgi:methyl-accepting chemotaxis protein|nr:methyl-accepting chemotaxis protein [Syntrophales bacterium]
MKFNLKMKIVLFVLIFALIIVSIGVSTIYVFKTRIIKTAHEKLAGDLAMGRALLNEKHPGAWSIREGKLFKGDTLMNGNFGIIDTIGELTGDTVTIFQGDTRVATNVKKPSGERAVGTKASQKVIDETLTGGRVYVGKAEVVGIWNQTAYEPIKNAAGEIIGILYVGVPNTRYDEITSDITGQFVIISLLGLLIVAVLSIFLIKSITAPLNRVIKGLSDGGSQVASASAQVLAASQALAEGSSEQASALEETSASLEELSSMTSQNAENANQANSVTLETGRVVNEANRSMQELTGAMQQITTGSEDMAKIIKTIDEIAFQTNLLALNAAVEAARAGEAGAGFAVVADEVRNLALRSAEAAKNTEDMIDESIKRIKNGSEIVTKTNEAFDRVLNGAKQVGGLVSEIAAASNEQAQGIAQISKAIAEMDKVVQQNAANAEESAAASEELSAQALQMKGYVGDMITVVRGNNATGFSAPSGHRPLTRQQRPALNSPTNGHAAKSLPARRKKGKITASGARIVRPEQIIPMDDRDEFHDF